MGAASMSPRLLFPNCLGAGFVEGWQRASFQVRSRVGQSSATPFLCISQAQSPKPSKDRRGDSSRHSPCPCSLLDARLQIGYSLSLLCLLAAVLLVALHLLDRALKASEQSEQLSHDRRKLACYSAGLVGQLGWKAPVRG